MHHLRILPFGRSDQTPLKSVEPSQQIGAKPLRDRAADGRALSGNDLT